MDNLEFVVKLRSAIFQSASGRVKRESLRSNGAGAGIVLRADRD
jgi:hypothetical protein